MITGHHITFRIGNDIPLDTAQALYAASTLGARRPIDDAVTFAAMMQHANLIVSAWDGPTLVGIARSMTDFLYVGYLADLAVHAGYQRRGIGTALIQRTREAMGPDAKIVLLAAPAAVDYYPKIGFTHHPQAWMLSGTDPFPARQR